MFCCYAKKASKSIEKGVDQIFSKYVSLLLFGREPERTPRREKDTYRNKWISFRVFLIKNTPRKVLEFEKENKLQQKRQNYGNDESAQMIWLSRRIFDCIPLLSLRF